MTTEPATVFIAHISPPGVPGTGKRLPCSERWLTVKSTITVNNTTAVCVGLMLLMVLRFHFWVFWSFD